MCPWNQQNKTHKDVRGPFVTKSQHTRYCWDYVRNIFPECPPPMLPPTDVRPPHHRCCSSCKMSFPLPLPNAPDVLHIAFAEVSFPPCPPRPPLPWSLTDESVERPTCPLCGTAQMTTGLCRDIGCWMSLSLSPHPHRAH